MVTSLWHTCVRHLFRRQAGCTRSASWTAVHFEHKGINGPVPICLRRFGRNRLIRVMIHCTSATWTFHVRFQIYSIYPYALAAISQGFRHPNEFGQKFIDPAQVSIIEKLTARIKHFLDT